VTRSKLGSVRGAQFGAKPKQSTPVLLVHDVWIEGHAATGGSSQALNLGQYPGETFEQACVTACSTRGLPHNPHSNTVWGCRMFDNEADARKEFG
jgi:hypothetical protein